MNKKLQKVLDEIEKTETKITQWQEHLKMLLIQKKQLEDTEILKSIRSLRVGSFCRFWKNCRKESFSLPGIITKIHVKVIFQKKRKQRRK